MKDTLLNNVTSAKSRFESNSLVKQVRQLDTILYNLLPDLLPYMFRFYIFCKVFIIHYFPFMLEHFLFIIATTFFLHFFKLIDINLYFHPIHQSCFCSDDPAQRLPYKSCCFFLKRSDPPFFLMKLPFFCLHYLHFLFLCDFIFIEIHNAIKTKL